MNRVRRIICEKLTELIRHDNVCTTPVHTELQVPTKQQQNTAGKKPALLWTAVGEKQEHEQFIQSLPQMTFENQLIDDVSIIPTNGRSATQVLFHLNPQTFVEAVLMRDANMDEVELSKQGHMVFDFSSPNIAKPFHVGHLRSTIIGNALANLHTHLGYNVTKLNYLGDWGTQFGMLQVGVDMLGITEEHIKLNPIENLYRAYTVANEALKSDPAVLEKARRYFTELETGTNKNITRQWEQYRLYTIKDLEKMYARLGVHFDLYEWESQYSQAEIRDVLAQLADNSLLLDEIDGRKVVQVDDRRVPIIKSDGSTLYLARDIAALVDRFQRFQFEKIFYVVDNGQTDHLNACFETIAALCKDKITMEELKHVKFGRIHGMSTRKGNAVLLRDVLDEARDIMIEKQLKSPTTKVEISVMEQEEGSIADVLGVSAVIINDLKQRRQRDYDFSWSKALQMNGDTGIKLQYTHCRLQSLLMNLSDIDLTGVTPQFEYLVEAEAQDLLFEIARFEQATWQARDQLEACILVNYLFNLCNATSRALKRLHVKNEPCRATQQNRLLLFRTAKDVLNAGMKILGLSPLDKM